MDKLKRDRLFYGLLALIIILSVVWVVLPKRPALPAGFVTQQQYNTYKSLMAQSENAKSATEKQSFLDEAERVKAEDDIWIKIANMPSDVRQGERDRQSAELREAVRIVQERGY